MKYVMKHKRQDLFVQARSEMAGGYNIVEKLEEASLYYDGGYAAEMIKKNLSGYLNPSMKITDFQIFEVHMTLYETKYLH